MIFLDVINHDAMEISSHLKRFQLALGTNKHSSFNLAVSKKLTESIWLVKCPFKLGTKLHTQNSGPLDSTGTFMEWDSILIYMQDYRNQWKNVYMLLRALLVLQH